MDGEWQLRRSWPHQVVVTVSLLLILAVWGIAMLEKQRSHRLLAESVGLAQAESGEVIGAVFRTAEVTDEQWALIEEHATIRTIDLSNKDFIEGGLKRLTSFKQLQLLDLSSAACVNDDDLTPLGELAQLRELRLNGTPVGDASAATFGRLSSLKMLSLNGTSVGDASVAAVCRLPSLRVLSLKGCTAITDDAVESLCQMDALQQVNLQGTSLSLAGFERLRNERRDLVIHVVPNQFVELGSFGALSSAAVSAEAAAEALLRKALLPHDWATGKWSRDGSPSTTAVSLGGPAVRALLPQLPKILSNLESLTLHDTTLGGEAALIPQQVKSVTLRDVIIGPEFDSIPPTVKELSLFEVASGSDWTWIGKITSLERLRFVSVGHIPPNGLRFVEELPNLISLDLAGADLSPEDVVSISHVKTLEVLDLSSVPITDEAAEPLQELLRLRYLSLYRSQISDEMLARFRTRFPDAQIVR